LVTVMVEKGFKQGDPISPYLFVVAMEVLSLLQEEVATTKADFQFLPKCKSLKLNHLCFADDHLIFSAAKKSSVRVVKEVLDEFEGLSGLKANPVKSSIFCVGLFATEKGDIWECLLFL